MQVSEWKTELGFGKFWPKGSCKLISIPDSWQFQIVMMFVTTILIAERSVHTFRLCHLFNFIESRQEMSLWESTGSIVLNRQRLPNYRLSRLAMSTGAAQGIKLG
jgi:hypothetical protein